MTLQPQTLTTGDLAAALDWAAQLNDTTRYHWGIRAIDNGYEVYVARVAPAGSEGAGYYHAVQPTPTDD